MFTYRFDALARLHASASAIACSCSIDVVARFACSYLSRIAGCLILLALWPPFFHSLASSLFSPLLFSSRPLSHMAMCFSFVCVFSGCYPHPSLFGSFCLLVQPHPFLCPLSCACVLLMFLFIIVCCAVLLQRNIPKPFQ